MAITFALFFSSSSEEGVETEISADQVSDRKKIGRGKKKHFNQVKRPNCGAFLDVPCVNPAGTNCLHNSRLSSSIYEPSKTEDIVTAVGSSFLIITYYNRRGFFGFSITRRFLKERRRRKHTAR